MDEDTDTTRSRDRRDRMLFGAGALIVIVLTALFTWGVTYKSAYGATRSGDSAIKVSTNASGQRVYNLHLAIQQEVSTGPHADWLGYQTLTNPVHPGTLLNVPKNALVTVTIDNYDSETAPRNEFFSLVQGTVGGVEYVNGKKLKVMDPAIMSHTFTIPDFGVSVPMEGIPDTAKPNAFETMKFTFRTPNRTGVFRWQCIVPCGSGLYAFGGPMGELGYMQGLFTLS
jgi:hypothetical protein